MKNFLKNGNIWPLSPSILKLFLRLEIKPYIMRLDRNYFYDRNILETMLIHKAMSCIVLIKE